MVKSFKADYSCRLYKITAKESQMSSIKNPSRLRTSENYREDTKKINTSQSGIKELCAFHAVNNFNFIENSTVDMMHDV